MKITDDYQAKYRLWAANPTVVPARVAPKIPGFKSRRFASHTEMNEWKQSVLQQLEKTAPPSLPRTFSTAPSPWTPFRYEKWSGNLIRLEQAL